MPPTAKEIMISKKITSWLWRLSRLLILGGQEYLLGFFSFSFPGNTLVHLLTLMQERTLLPITATPFKWSGLFRRTILPTAHWNLIPIDQTIHLHHWGIGLNLLNKARCSLDQTSSAWPLARPSPAAVWIKPLQHGSLPSLAALWMK